MNTFSLLILNLFFLLFMTTLGSAFVYFLTKPSNKINTITNGFASGIMFSASIFSLLIPAIDYGEKGNFLSILPIVLGFVIGCIFISLLDFLITKSKNTSNEHRRIYKLFSAMTLHNIPEGLSVGFTFGSSVVLGVSPIASVLMAVGIAIQNFPEGLSISLPMYNVFKNKHKSFLFGALTGVVEPLFGILGFFLATKLSFIMPWLLSFSAGSMIYVVIEEFMPSLNDEGVYGTWSFIVGFLFMLILDISL